MAKLFVLKFVDIHREVANFHSEWSVHYTLGVGDFDCKLLSLIQDSILDLPFRSDVHLL